MNPWMEVLHKIDAVVVAVLFLVKLLVFVEVVQINTGRNVVSVAVLFQLILHDYAEVVRTNTVQSVLFVVELFQKKSEGSAVGVRANIKLDAINAART